MFRIRFHKEKTSENEEYTKFIELQQVPRVGEMIVFGTSKLGYRQAEYINCVYWSPDEPDFDVHIELE